MLHEDMENVFNVFKSNALGVKKMSSCFYCRGFIIDQQFVRDFSFPYSMVENNENKF